MLNLPRLELEKKTKQRSRVAAISEDRVVTSPRLSGQYKIDFLITGEVISELFKHLDTVKGLCCLDFLLTVATELGDLCTILDATSSAVIYNF